MAQPGASSIFYGGSIAYNTLKGKALLLNDDVLHQSLTSSSSPNYYDKNTKNGYVQSKFDWTAKTSVAFCKALDTDYAIAEGGAAGPSFGPDDMDAGFAVLSVAGKVKCNSAGDHDGNDKRTSVVKVLKQKVVHSSHNGRKDNMRLFADAASELLREVVEEQQQQQQQHESQSQSQSQGQGQIIREQAQGGQNEKSHDHTPIVVIDRATSLRTDAKALAELEPLAKYVIVKNNEMLFRSPTELALLSNDQVSHLKNNTNNNTKDGPNGNPNQMTFLGRLSDYAKTPLFGIDVLEIATPPDVDVDVDVNKDTTNNAAQSSDPSFDGYFFADTRTNAPLLPPLENELALHMMAYANWQRRSKFCTSCGSPLSLIHAGTAQQCTSCSCKALSWPRQDPSMIASIISRCGKKILLARSQRHPPKMHTVLAGFVEAGETFEAAVARETWEETGIRIDEGSVEYIGSQPWPFPQSCMIAFTATADDSQVLNIDENELVEAKWFDRRDVEAATRVVGAVMQHEVAKAALAADPTLPLLVPPKRVIARTLIDTWLNSSSNSGY